MSPPRAASAGPLVVVGSSAGGIEALSVVFGSLRADFPAPLVIAQHLDPNRASQLGTILERRCVLPVVLVSETRRLEPGHVYVVPSNKHVVIQDGHVALEGDHGQRPRPSVDLLLSTAAESYAERLIAVVLTGSGSDGAAGAVDVKAAGGTVIIQNPQTAAYPSMPLALPPTAVDHVAELAAIGPLLHDLVTGGGRPEAEASGESPVLPDILALVSRHATIDFHAYKPSTLLRRISRRMTVTHSRNMADYLEHLQAHPQEVGELVMALLIKVTEFFRDPEAFAYLAREVMPGLIERGREQGRVLRLWSAGCATGEEAYSLALLVAEHLAGELAEWTVKIFATDVDDSAIDFARRGFYPANILANLSSDQVARWFERSDQGFRVSKQLRQMVIFGQQDLTRGVPFPRVDLVVCRNLLIYFKPELQEEVMDVFAFSLHQTQGHLFLGKAETARPSRATFELVNKKWKVYRCVQGPLPGGRRLAQQGAILAASSAERAAGRAPAERAAGAEPAAEAEIAQLRRLNEVLLRFTPVGMIVVDRHYRILTINHAGRRLLGIRETAPDQDFLHAVRGLNYEDLRSAIDQVFHERAPVSIAEALLTHLPAGDARYLSIHVAPVAGEGLALEAVLVSAVEVTEHSQLSRRMEALQTEQRQLLDELGAANRRLGEANKELQDANEELQAANEELMLAQEELQATNEEFEATNEELQATNEELETNNEELQATNEELETTNEELQARTGELQELNRIVTGERLRLAEMVELAPFYIVVLRGPALVVEALNPASGRIFGQDDLVGMPFEAVCRDQNLEPLLAGVREVVRRDRSWTSGRVLTAVRGPDGFTQQRQLVYSVVPSHDDERRVVGAVVYVEDVTEKIAREDRERLDVLRLMVEHASPVALALFDAATGALLHSSPRYNQIVERLGLDAPVSGQPYTFERVGLLDSAQASALRTGALDGGAPVRIPELRTEIGGQAVVWDWSLIPIAFASNGGPRGARYLLLVVFDVSEPVRLREELSSLDRLKDEFLALASHELRTPLVPLTTYTEVMQDLVRQAGAKGASSEWLAPFVELAPRMRRQVDYLARLTDDLLDVARLQTGTFGLDRQPVDLRNVVRQAREQGAQIAGAPPIELSEDAPAPAAIMGDEGRLVQAVSNLLTNAARYASGSKRVDLRLVRTPADALRIEVQDYGPGIPREDQARLFTRFYRAPTQRRPARSGLGLGLFICRQIVERHGGRIGLDSTPGQGATFWLEFPAEGSGLPAEPPDAARAEAVPPARRRRPASRPGPGKKRGRR